MEEVEFSSGVDVITWLELANKEVNFNIQRIQEKIIYRKNLLNLKEFNYNEIILKKINWFLSSDFSDNLKCSEGSIQIEEIKSVISIKKNEFESLKNKIISQIKDIEWLSEFLHINNIENFSPLISTFSMPILEDYEGIKIIEATLEKIIISSRSILNNNNVDLTSRKMISNGMDLIRNFLQQPNKMKIAQLIDNLKQLDDNGNFYWKIKVIPLESYLKKWDQLRWYQNQMIMQSFQIWKNLSIEEKAQKEKELSNKLQLKLSSAIINYQRLGRKNKMIKSNNNNEETLSIEKFVELKKTDILDSGYKSLIPVEKIDFLENIVGEYISKINSLESSNRILANEKDNARKNVDKLTKTLAAESQKSKELVGRAENIVREEFSDFVYLLEILKLEANEKNKSWVKKLLFDNAIEEQGLSGLVKVIELRDKRIIEREERIEILETGKISLEKKISELNLEIDNNLVFNQRNNSRMMSDLIFAEQTIRELQLEDRAENYSRYSEQRKEEENEELENNKSDFEQIFDVKE